MSHLLEQQIAEIKEFIQTQVVLQKDILNLSEAAIYLGISKSSLYKLSSNRSIPCYKPGNKLVYFEKSELRKWILSNRISSATELKEGCFKKANTVR